MLQVWGSVYENDEVLPVEDQGQRTDPESHRFENGESFDAGMQLTLLLEHAYVLILEGSF